MAPTFETIITAVIQGITEFLPVSSSTHLTLAATLGGWVEPSLALKVGMHVGTLIAVVVYFWQDLWSMATGILQWLFKRQNSAANRQAWFLVLATLPVVGVGYLVHKLWPNQAYTPFIMGSASIVGGLLMIWADRFSNTRSIRQWYQALAVGLGQVIAIVWPGSSRSGSCLTIARFLGIERFAALRFTFLLSVPAVLGAATLMIKDLADTPIDWPQLLWGMSIAAGVGLLTIHSLYQLWSARALQLLGIYRVILGVLVLSFL